VILEKYDLTIKHCNHDNQGCHLNIENGNVDIRHVHIISHRSITQSTKHEGFKHANKGYKPEGMVD
jgi:hypothetical protein